MANKKSVWTWLKWGLSGLLLVLLVCGLFILYAKWLTEEAGEGKIYDDVSEVPAGRVGLVFGCAKTFQGRSNLYFYHRMEAAAALWHAAKVRGFIVSGDNRRNDYNEPEDMKQRLIELGVPAEKIVCDYAGLRTLDSVVRAKEIFDVERVVFISQRFQNERAQYMAKHSGMDAVSFNAQDVAGRGGLKTKLRELLARPKMLLDLHLLRVEPKHLGECEELLF